MILQLNLAKHNLSLLLVHKNLKSPKEYCTENVDGHLAIVNDNDGNPIDLNIQYEENNKCIKNGDEDEDEIIDAEKKSSRLHDLHE